MRADMRWRRSPDGSKRPASPIRIVSRRCRTRGSKAGSTSTATTVSAKRAIRSREVIGHGVQELQVVRFQGQGFLQCLFRLIPPAALLKQQPQVVPDASAFRQYLRGEFQIGHRFIKAIHLDEQQCQ